MKVTKELTGRLATLARLDFDNQSLEEISGDLEKIIGFVEKLNELDTEGIEPLEYITEEQNVLRPDVVSWEVEKADALRLAPIHDSDYIKVPKVLKKG